MAESIIKVPQCAASDMDFLAFSFNGKHSWDDFHIYRTSEGDRYNENLTPTLTDKTAEVPGGDGMYYFGTTHKQRDFNISFVFDSLTEVQLRELKRWLNGKEMGDLWFQETPYKVWTAKPTGNLSIKYIPFDDENGKRVYKGEGTVQFVAYWPYAHTPDFVRIETFNIKAGATWLIGSGKLVTRYFYIEGVENANKIIQFRYNRDDGLGWRWSPLADKTAENSQLIDLGHVGTVANIRSKEDVSIKIYKVIGIGDSSTRTLIYNEYPGKRINSYNSFQNHELWEEASSLNSSTDTCIGENPGDLPAPFTVSVEEIEEGDKITIGETSITITCDCTNLEWNSKTGIVKANVTGKTNKVLVAFTGNSIGSIPVGGINQTSINIQDKAGVLYTNKTVTLDYDYWYY